MRNASIFWLGSLKRPLGRRRRRWEYNIRRDLIEVGCEGVDWIRLVRDRDQWRAVGNKVMKLGFCKRRRSISSLAK
jgi:hypothetical protein